jgi:hypothetical protein
MFSLPELMFKFAIAKAREQRLEHDGVIWCWACSEGHALIPSLHCHRCLAAEHRRVGRLAPLCTNREQTPEDVEACHRE